MDDEFTPLAPHGRRRNAPRNERGQYVSEPKITNVKSGGNGRTYIVRRLLRDQKTELIAMVRRREISARAAAQRAGFCLPPKSHRPPKSAEPKPVDVDTFVKSLIG